MTIARKKTMPLDEWLACVNRYLDFCLDRTAESFEGVFWEELHRRGVDPIEAVVATVIELSNMRREEVTPC